MNQNSVAMRGPTPPERLVGPDWNDGEAGEDGQLFLSIPLSGLRIDTVLHCDLYVKSGVHRFVKYRDQGEPITNPVIVRLREFNHEFLYIPLSKRDEFNRYIEQVLPDIVRDPNVAVEHKAKLVFHTIGSIIQNVMQSPSSAFLSRAEAVVDPYIELITSGPEAISSLLTLVSYDYYTYTHSVQVGVFSAALASRLKINSHKDMRNLALASLFHDIGKTFIPNEILMKPRSLSRDEFATVREHPALGANIVLHERGNLDEVSLIVRQHHERLDGSGYPDGAKTERIHPLSKIITIADMYDALTSRRVYRGGYSPVQALRMVSEHAGEWIDETVFREFVKLLGTIGPA
ncbi:MAG: HD-GYP domain-containing protein [bacterium]|nr:HD-GYP domain-containing protein [bacterium]